MGVTDLAAPRAEREDDQTDNNGALVLGNRPTSVPITGTEETSIGGWKIR